MSEFWPHKDLSGKVDLSGFDAVSIIGDTTFLEVARSGGSEMTDRIAEESPSFKARMAGVFQLLEGLTATYGEVVVAGNAAATAANILGHERLFWLGFVLSLIGVAFHIAWAFLMYELLKPVNKSLSLLAAFVILVGCSIQALASLLYLAPLLILQGGSSVSA